MKGFIYGQTEYNMLANSNRLDDYISLAKKHSFDFLTITDSNLYGNYKFYKKCMEANIKPIIGLEFSYKTEDQNISKALLYAKNNNGYKSLLKISKLVKTEGLEDIEAIKEYDDISIIFVFNDSFFERLIYAKEHNILIEYLNKIKEFKDPYIGVSYTNKLSKLELNKQMEAYAQETDVRCLPIHQCRYLAHKDVKIYEALTKIGDHPVMIDQFDDYSFEINPMSDSRVDEFVKQIHLNLFNDKIELPKYPNTKGASSKDFLRALCIKGIEKRGKASRNYYERLDYELSVINKMGYDDYFLIVWDFIKYAKQKNILVGPGRGSAAGSLVSYALGITEVDPIKYDLLFERFLNPERISMPDIDTDFPDIYRDDVIEHVKNVYGKEHVCNISAFGTFLVKSSIRDLARIYKIDDSRVEKIIAMVLQYGYDRLLEEYKDNELYEFLYIARGIEGLPRHISTHAAGIILSSVPLDEIIPLQEGINGLFQSQLEASDLERIGLLKMDFLGIKNLTMLDGMMQDAGGFDMRFLRGLPLDDAKTFKLLQTGDTLGIFQLESQGIRQVMTKLKPTCFEDLVAVLALYRPGPMDNIDEFIRRKHKGDFKYIHPVLEPILKPTYGIIVYQEQIMKIAQTFAGYSLGEADVLRRAVSKKDSTMLDALEADFINKSINKGYSKNIAKDIYDLIYKFANYGFNRSHSVAYAMLSYQMAYFKANYFPIFMANVLNDMLGSQLGSYIKYAKERGVKVAKPNINFSTTKFVLYNNELIMPLNSITSIGYIVANQILEERNKGIFKTYEEFRQRCGFLSESVIRALVFSGALDCFGRTKKSMCDSITEFDLAFARIVGSSSKGEYSFDELKENEYKYLGLNLEYNIFSNFDELSKKYKSILLANCRMNYEARVIASITEFKEITTKNNEKMLVGHFEDPSANKRFVIFPNVYNSLSFKVSKECLYDVFGKLERDNKNEETFTIKKIEVIK